MGRKQNHAIMQLAKDLQSLAKKAVTAYMREVDDILDSSCREKHRVERTLDGMLDFCFDKNMLVLYKKLCRYYYATDQNAASEYALAYRDMWELKDSDNRKNRIVHKIINDNPFRGGLF